MFKIASTAFLKCGRGIHTINNEKEYLGLVERVIKNGEIMNGRNGKTIGLFGEKMVFSLKNNTVPVLTTKKFAWKTCIKELLWFINGDTNNDTLSNQGVGIWDKNASAEFKKSIGVKYTNPGDLGPIYGHQWRHFNADYSDCNENYKGQGVDQFQNIINNLNNLDTRYSRRHVMSAWNPCQLEEMVLPPCHILSHFSVNNRDELSAAVYQRSGDVGLGVPFNIASYSFLVCLLAEHCGLVPNKLVHFIGDAHIYESHIAPLNEQIKIRPFPSPTFRIKKRDCINDYEIDDFSLNDYKYNSKIKMNMIA